MGVIETLRILLTIFLSTACIQNVRLFGVYDVRWPFLAEIHTAPLKRFVPSSVLQAVRALRNAPAASAVFLAGVAPVISSYSDEKVFHCIALCHWFSSNRRILKHINIGRKEKDEVDTDHDSCSDGLVHTHTHIYIYIYISRLVPSQWETALLCNDVSRWLGASLESALYMIRDQHGGCFGSLHFSSWRVVIMYMNQQSVKPWNRSCNQRSLCI